jgi:NitT/TauT family transport system substrate-binding protein
MTLSIGFSRPARAFLKRFKVAFLAWFILAFGLSLLINGCSVTASKPTHLRVGMNSWPGYALGLYSQAEGLFEKRGLEVEFVQFINQQDNIEATMRGALDASFVPLWEVMQVPAGTEQPAVVMVADISAGADGIVARPGINSVADLKGKKVGVKLGTVTHLILLEALKSQQINSSDVQLVDVSNEIGIQRLKDGKLDAAVVWEPTLSETAKAIKGKVIFTTADVDSLVIDSLATRASYAQENQKALTQFVLGWLDAVHAVDTNPDQVFAVIGEQLGKSGQAFGASYTGLEKGDLIMNQRMFEGGRLSEAVQQIQQLVESDPQQSQVLNTDVIIEAAPVTAAVKDWKPLS